MESDPRPSVDYREFLESTPVVPWEIDARSGRLTYAGPQATTLLGHPIEAWLDPGFWSRYVLPDDQAAFFEAREKLLKEGGSHVIEFRMEHADGHLLWISETAAAQSHEGRVRRARGLLGDITERKRMEAEVVRNEERLRALLRAAPDALIFTERDGTIVDLNDQARHLFGYSLPEVRGSSVDLLVPEEPRRRLADHRTEFAIDPARHTLVDGQAFWVQHSGGHWVEVELRMSVVPTGVGRRLLHSFRDVGPRPRRGGGDSPTAEAFTAGAPRADCRPAVLCDVSADLRYRSVSERYSWWHGRAREEMIGRRVSDLLAPEVYDRARPAIERALAGEVVHVSVLVNGLGDSEHALELTYVPRREQGTVAGYFLVVADIDRGSRSSATLWDLRRSGARRQEL